MLTPRTYTPLFIAEIAVLQTSPPADRDEFRQQFGELQAAFSLLERIYWLFPGPVTAGLRRSFRQEKVEIVPVPFARVEGESVPMNLKWLQDPFVVVPGNKGLTFYMYHRPDRWRYNAVKALAEKAGAEVKATGLPLEGGNTRRVADRWFFGLDLVLKYQQKEKPQQEFFDALHATTDVLRKMEPNLEPVPLGNTELRTAQLNHPAAASASLQPFFHLDLLVLPCGTDLHGQARVAVGTIDQPPQNPRQQELHHFLNQSLEKVTEELEKAFLGEVEIIRIPLHILHDPQRPRLISHCNGILDGDAVLLPDFTTHDRLAASSREIARHQERVQQVFARHHVPVRFVPLDFYDDLNQFGALNCRVKIIRHHQAQSLSHEQ